MNIKTFTVNPLGVNCYVVSHGGEAAIIDCGCFSEKEWTAIRDYIEAEHLCVKHVLLTHGHFDHIYGLRFVERDLQLKPCLHKLDEQTYLNAMDMAFQFIGVRLPGQLPNIDCFLTDGQKLVLGRDDNDDKQGVTLEVLHTPGHTPGGVSFYCAQEGIVFSGDTLFQGSLGRTDFPGGDMQTEIDSIRERLFTLPDQTRVLPGHGPATTIAYEKMYNPYF